MFDDKSRYRQQPLRDHILADGATVKYVLPRWLPEPGEAITGAVHRATDSDRIDNLAYRHFGVPTAWWMIAEAGSAMHPATIGDTPGETIVIPIPGTGLIKG